MFNKFRLRPAVAMPCARLWRYRLPAVLTVTAMLAQGCAQTPPQIFAGPDAADPNVAIAPAAYRPVFGTYVSQRPVGPSPWLEQNRQVAPKDAAPTPEKGGAR